MFLPAGTTVATADTTRYDYIQAADSATMQSLFATYLIALIVANSVPMAPQLNIIDMDIAGGGDGHTFVVRILVSTATPSVGWMSNVLAQVRAQFWMGANAEALESYQEGAIAALVLGGTPQTNIAVGLAGAAKGTRFMAFIASQDNPQQ